MTLLLSHHACLDHLTPPGHPERPDRLRAIWQILDDPDFEPLDRKQSPYGDEETILLCHPQSHFDKVRRAIPEDGLRAIDGDTCVSDLMMKVEPSGLAWRSQRVSKKSV